VAGFWSSYKQTVDLRVDISNDDLMRQKPTGHICKKSQQLKLQKTA